MFLARTNASGTPVIGIGLSTSDVQRLVAGRPMSFAMRDADIDGPEADERVLVAFAKPHQVEQLKHGYPLGLTDARVLLFIDHRAMEAIQVGGALTIQTPGTPVAKFVVFAGETPSDAVRAFRAAGIPAIDSQEPEPQPEHLTAPLTADQLEAATAAV